LPRNASLKVDRAAVRRLFDRHDESDAPHTTEKQHVEATTEGS
jgi:hypothetical protein